MVSANLQDIIENNISLCKNVFDQYEISSKEDSDIFYTQETVPQFYPNVITKSTNFQVDKFDLGNINSLKDSFNCLDLKNYGFEKLFTSTWYGLEKGNYVNRSNGEYQCVVVASKTDFQIWRDLWCKSNNVRSSVFLPSFLQSSGLLFILVLKEEEVVAGCLINTTSSAIGLSNCFGLSRDSLASILNFLFATFKNKPIVGYENGVILDLLIKFGAQTFGNLAVWQLG